MSAPVIALLLTLAAVLGGLHLLEQKIRYGSKQRRVQSARWATRRDLRELFLGGRERGRLVLGRHGRRLLATVDRSSVLVFGPTRIAGKTSAFTIPAVLEWDGPLVATSSKTDLLFATIGRRRSLGKAMVFDPTGWSDLGNVKATPLSGCHDWFGAIKTAHRLASAARTASDGLEDSAFWYAAATKLLQPLLFAAASGGDQMADVVRWLNEGASAEEEVAQRLHASGCEQAMSAWRANWNREERQRSSIYTTAETILAPFEDPRVQAASSRADYTPEQLLDGGANTLFLCGPAHEQERLRALFAAMITELVELVETRASASGEAIDPPLLIVADEAANTAPIPNLDGLASTGAGQGIQLVSVFQDLAQIEARYGNRARTILNNHLATVFPTGISDPATLEYVDRVVGAGEFRQLSETEANRGRGSSTEASTFRPLAPANVVREAPANTAILVYGHRPPARITLRPWFGDDELQALACGAHDDQ